MPNWRRVFVPGGTYAFTLVTEGRAPILTTPKARALLREKLRACRQSWPFEIIGIVLLPEHLHTVWRLPDGDSAYPARIGWLKKEVTRAWLAAGGVEEPLSASRLRNRRRGLWQPRFWEHCIRDEADLHAHLDYLHYNPVKHGHVARARDWAWSSFHRYVRTGAYPPDWGCRDAPIDSPETGFGEPG
jgi:putative transposase